MQDLRLKAAAWISGIREIAAKVFGGRYSRSAWALDAVLWVAIPALLLVPLWTFISTSPRLLRDFYFAFAVLVSALCVIGFVLGFAKRLHDQNRNGLWSIPILWGSGWALIKIAEWWVRRVAKEHPFESVGDAYGLALGLFAAVITVIAMLPSRNAEQRGPRISARDIFRTRHPSVFLALVTAAFLVPVSIYAGLLQDGIWVRQKPGNVHFFGGPDPLVPDRAYVIAACGNAKGISAYSQKSAGSGFVRDAVEGSWNLVVLPDGRLDIMTSGGRQNRSFIRDGFEISTRGLLITRDQGIPQVVDHFLVVAAGADADPTPAIMANSAHNVTVLNFVRHESNDWQVLISSSQSGWGGVAGALGFGVRASSYLMMADCRVFQAVR